MSKHNELKMRSYAVQIPTDGTKESADKGFAVFKLIEDSLEALKASEAHAETLELILFGMVNARDEVFPMIRRGVDGSWCVRYVGDSGWIVRIDLTGLPKYTLPDAAIQILREARAEQ